MCASSVLMCAWGDAWCVPNVCLGGAWHGIVRHKLGKVCKTHTQWSKHGNQVQSRVFPKIGTYLSPNQYKNEHFDKHLACNTVLHEWTMHEHIKKCLNTSLKCHKGPTQIHTSEMGHNPVKILENFA